MKKNTFFQFFSFYQVDVEQSGAKEREVAKMKQVLLDLGKKMDEEKGKTDELHAGLEIEADNFRLQIQSFYNQFTLSKVSPHSGAFVKK